MRPRGARPRSGAGSWGASAVFLLFGIVAAGIYVEQVSTVWSDAAFAAVGLGSLIALIVGPRWHRAEPRGPWVLLAIAGAGFLTGALVRPVTANLSGPTAFAADMFTVPGYLIMIAAIAGLLQVRGSVERHALIDGLIVGVGAALAVFLLLAVPAASIPGRALGVSILSGTYPLFDVVVLILLVNLAFTTAIYQPAYLLLVSMITLLLVGDLGYALLGTQGQLTSHSPWYDLPFVLGFTMIGAAALHPSIVELGRLRTLPVQAWSWRRLLLIVPAVAAPFVLTAVLDHPRMLDRLVLGAGGAVIVTLLIFRAVSAVQSYAAAQRRYEYQATHDLLTGLPNRIMLTSQVDKLLAATGARGTQVWMYFLDLDGFKLVNDSWGHATGDQLIAEVGRRLRAIVPADATVARVGGDEFVIVHRSTEPVAVTLAEKILECFAQPLRTHNAEVVISASVGIAGVPVEVAAIASTDALMRDADTAMYQAKADGPGKWTVFDTPMHERVRERVEIELALRQAVSQQELRLVYQPIVDLATGRIIGAEALARWDHPTRGPISPDVFIPIAEDTAMISPLGRWVIDESLRQLAYWRRDGTVSDEFYLSINVSPRQLRNVALVGTVSDALIRYRIPADAVVLEITESVMIDPFAVTDQVLYDLRALGARIVVDDFGTGYSALGYLRRHPVTGVKVDRAFVNGLGANGKDEEIVRAVVAMSNALGLTVVAEGVETSTQQAVLASLGVQQGQGHLWSAAMTPVDFGRRWSAVSVPDGHASNGSNNQ